MNGTSRDSRIDPNRDPVVFERELAIGKSFPEEGGTPAPDPRVECIRFEIHTTRHLLGWPEGERQRLRGELDRLLGKAFPRMPGEDRLVFVRRFFVQPGPTACRMVFLVKNRMGGLIGTALLEQREVVWTGRTFEAVYLNLRAVTPEYQGSDIGQIIAEWVLSHLQPHLCMTTCTQSSSLHSWIRLPRKGLVKGFSVYPQVEDEAVESPVATLPAEDLSMTVSVFKQLFLSILDDNTDRLAQVLRNLTVLMARRNVHHGMYDFHPWVRRGRLDSIAEALGLTELDGVLVVFRRSEIP